MVVVVDGCIGLVDVVPCWFGVWERKILQCVCGRITCLVWPSMRIVVQLVAVPQPDRVIMSLLVGAAIRCEGNVAYLGFAVWQTPLVAASVTLIVRYWYYTEYVF